MKLTDLIQDPYADIGKAQEPNEPVLGEGRQAVREVLEEAVEDADGLTVAEPVRAVLQEQLATDT
jgi:hypothetical protein